MQFEFKESFHGLIEASFHGMVLSFRQWTRYPCVVRAAEPIGVMRDRLVNAIIHVSFELSNRLA